MKRRLQIALAVVLVIGGLYAGYRIWFTPLAAEAVTEGEKAPEFSLVSHTGADVNLTGLLTNGPAVVIFYRGHW